MLTASLACCSILLLIIVKHFREKDCFTSLHHCSPHTHTPTPPTSSSISSLLSSEMFLFTPSRAPPAFTAHPCAQRGASCNSGPCIDAVQLFSNPGLDFDPLPFRCNVPQGHFWPGGRLWLSNNLVVPTSFADWGSDGWWLLLFINIHGQLSSFMLQHLNPHSKRYSQ